jgi:Concanavalin A-like lectin/glucanases superfamily
MARVSSRVLFGVLVLALTVALGCGGSEPSDLPDKVIDTPFVPPVNNTLTIADKHITHDLALTEERVPWSETGEKNPRILRLGRGGSMHIDGDEAIDLALLGDFTLELWIRPMGKSQPQILTMKGLRLSMHNGLLKVETSGEPLQGPELRSREWHHVAIVVEQQQLTVYVNGKRGSTKQVDATWAPKGAVTLGVTEGSNRGPFVGEMDNFRLVSGARYKKNFLPSQTFTPADTHFAYDFNGISRGTFVPATWGNKALLNGDANLVPGSI